MNSENLKKVNFLQTKRHSWSKALILDTGNKLAHLKQPRQQLHA